MSYRYHEVVSETSKKVCIVDHITHGEIVKKLDPGEVICVDDEAPFFNWVGESYYKVKKPAEGWINTKAVGEVLNGKHFS